VHGPGEREHDRSVRDRDPLRKLALLVTRQQSDAEQAERERRYGHIRAFEQLLIDRGTTLIKCFLHISKDEQRRRLQQRIDDPDRRWKIDQSDLEARARWSNYQRAYELALGATATAQAPWTIVPSDSKSHRNLMVMQIVLQALEQIAPAYPPGPASLAGVRVE